jgi:hypothetical protein
MSPVNEQGKWIDSEGDEPGAWLPELQNVDRQLLEEDPLEDGHYEGGDPVETDPVVIASMKEQFNGRYGLHWNRSEGMFYVEGGGD